MKKQRLLVLSLIPFLAAGCSTLADDSSAGDTSGSTETSSWEPSSSNVDTASFEAVEPTRKEINVTMLNHFSEGEDENYVDTAVYDDNWFLADSHTPNMELAVLSAMTGGASYSTSIDRNGVKIANMMSEMGFHGIETNEYYAKNITLEDSIGVIMGKKEIIDTAGKTFTLLSIFPRDAGYGEEWYGDFNTGASGIHQGFLLARDEALRFMKHYIENHDVHGDVKVWCAGYSRGAATADLLGGFLVEDSGYFGSDITIKPSDIYVYNIATPGLLPDGLSKTEVLSVSGPRQEGFYDTDVAAFAYEGDEGVIHPTDDKYKCIHNYIESADFVPKLPPEEWGFGRYGNVERIEFGGEAFVNNLAEISAKAAEKFEGGKTYSTMMAKKTFDLASFKLVDAEGTNSAKGFIEDIIGKLETKIGSRENLVNEGYADILGSAVAFVASDLDAFKKNLFSNLFPVIKALLLNYCTHAVSAMNVSEEVGVANALMDLVELTGKHIDDRENYTDQQFLADVLDYLINDYQTSEQARNRAANIQSLLPAPYGDLYVELLEFAKDNGLVARTIDDAIYLIAHFVNSNQENEGVKSLIDLLASLLPENTADLLTLITANSYAHITDPTEKARTAIKDIFSVSEFGQVNSEGVVLNDGNAVRRGMLTLLGFVLFPGMTNLANLMQHGVKNSEGEPQTMASSTMPELSADLLKFLLPKDSNENTVSLEEGANITLSEAFNALKTDRNQRFVEVLAANPAKIRETIFDVLLPSGEYSLAGDVAAVANSVNVLMFLVPVHFHELYISCLKTKI